MIMLLVKGDFINHRGVKISITKQEEYLTRFSDGSSVITKTIKEIQEKHERSVLQRLFSLIKFKVKFAKVK